MLTKVEHSQLVDYENRIKTISTLAEMIGLNKEDALLLMFLTFGDTAENASLPDVIKKIKLPNVKGKYNKEKMKRYCRLIANRLKELDNYGIVDLDREAVLRMSRNKEYITVFGMEIIPIVYYNIYHLLVENPDYFVNVILGIKQSLDIIVKFLDIEAQ